MPKRKADDLSSFHLSAQFRLLVFHRSGKTNCVADALSRLPSVGKPVPRDSDDLDALHADTNWDVPDHVYAFLTSAVSMMNEFKARVRNGCETDPRWSMVIKELGRVASDLDPVKEKLPYELDDGLLYSIQQSGEYWL
ncbi:hypothetical protein N7462_007198 [Penicillium macrosclerotiorum]|uniref:uncharacterized protein n=1 Tax=Penicillium macrosclerotiorum TaxID=303699 RepID=UPI002547686F|nr:uncharacterized protein N7462_007198 [Penicillium macrosclerotiorum]KAJ5678954.1 hypothetical protein N7462_007198 [Penicillium macrosclerotiorum]